MALKKVTLYVDEDTGEVVRQYESAKQEKLRQDPDKFFWFFYKVLQPIHFSGSDFKVLSALAKKMTADNMLTYNTVTPIDSKGDLALRLASSKNAGYIKLKEWEENGLICENNGVYFLNKETIRKGSIRGLTMMELRNQMKAKVKVSYDGVDAVLKGTSFRRLALLVSLIPYLNLEHNVISDAVFEWEWKDVTPLSDLEIVERLGLLPSTAKRIPSYLLEPIITIRGHRQKMVALVDGKYVLNPRIFYGGSHFKEVLKNFSDLY